MRGRNRKSHNPLTRVYESNGPDVKIRGTASHIAEKYIQLARDAQSSGDPIGAENYFQHAEHYYRLIASAQEQFRQNQPFYGNRPEGGGAPDMRDDTFDEGDEDAIGQPGDGGEQPAFGPRDPQPFLPRDAQFYSPRDQQSQHGPRPQPYVGTPQPSDDSHVDRLPSFITGGGQPQGQGGQGPQGHAQGGNGPNGHDQGERGPGDRYPPYRRRRRHHGPRNDMSGGRGMGRDSDESPE